MSYDKHTEKQNAKIHRLNPFGTGQCLTTVRQWVRLALPTKVSIPLEQGNVLRLRIENDINGNPRCLNPFGTGQCLTTLRFCATETISPVSIPLEQGNVLRHKHIA